MFKFGKKSLENLAGVDTDLILVLNQAIAISAIDFGITEGMRSPERARQMKAEGKSKVGDKSKHCTGLAVDIVCYHQGKITWEYEFYEMVAQVIGEVADTFDIKIRWGGSWVTGVFELNRDLDFIDAVHFEIIK